MKAKERTLNILNELVKNALDAEATDININIKSNSDTLEITVQDNGSGMDEETLKKAKDRLNQEHMDVYDEYYSGLTGSQQAGSGLNLVGFQVDESTIETSSEGTTVRVRRNPTKNKRK